MFLSLPAGRQTVVLSPVGTTGTTDGFVVTMSLAKTARLARSRGKTPDFSVLLGGSTHPVKLWVTTDGFVGGINHNHLIKLISGILTDPVAVHYTQSTAFTASTLLKHTNNSTNEGLIP